MPENPTSTWSPTASPANLVSNEVMNEPLALVKKMHQETEDKQDKNKNIAHRHIQVTAYKKLYCINKSVTKKL